MDIRDAMNKLFKHLKEVYKSFREKNEKKFNNSSENIIKILEFLEKESSKLEKHDRKVLEEILKEIIKSMKLYNFQLEVKETLIQKKEDLIKSFDKTNKLLNEIKENINFYLDNLIMIIPLIVAHIVNNIYISLNLISNSNDKEKIKRKILDVYRNLKEIENKRREMSKDENIDDIIKADLAPIEDAMKNF